LNPSDRAIARKNIDKLYDLLLEYFITKEVYQMDGEWIEEARSEKS